MTLFSKFQSAFGFSKGPLNIATVSLPDYVKSAKPWNPRFDGYHYCTTDDCDGESCCRIVTTQEKEHGTWTTDVKHYYCVTHVPSVKPDGAEVWARPTTQ